jgi:hypothetical protein
MIRANQRSEAIWPERWFDRLAEKYHTPPALLERLLTPDDLIHEVARLIADAVVAEAKDFAAAPAKDRVARKQSADWFDILVVEREKAQRTAQLAKQKKD